MADTTTTEPKPEAVEAKEEPKVEEKKEETTSEETAKVNFLPPRPISGV